MDGLRLDGIDAAGWCQKKIMHLKMVRSAGVERVYRGTLSYHRIAFNVFRDDYKGTRRSYNAFKLTGQRPDGYDAKEFAKLKNASDSLKGLNKASKAIINNERMSGEQKREQLDKINMRKANIAQGVYGFR